MPKLLVIADDFTGALDTAVQFVSGGVSLKVLTPPIKHLDQYVDGVDVLVIDAETRHLSPEHAYEIITEIVRQALALKIPYIYKKTDSALRGNVGSELKAVLDASGEAQLVFLPAYPQNDVGTIGGKQYIQGIPVAESVFGADPFEPVKYSRIDEIINSQSDVSVYSISDVDAEQALPEENGILVFDATTIERLESIGQRLHKEERMKIMAGCAGFATVIPGILGLTGKRTPPTAELNRKLLVICGSVNRKTLVQMDYAEKNGATRIRLTPEQKLDEHYWLSEEGETVLQRINDIAHETPLCIVDANDAQEYVQTDDVAIKQNLELDAVRKRVARSLGYIVQSLAKNPNVGTMLITGGDTLLECMNYMDIRELEPIDEIQAGVVISRYEKEGQERYIISKSGGFGGEDLLVRIAEQLGSENKTL